jgi:glutamate racemase
VRARSLACARWLAEQGAGAIVVACNTATSAAVETLRAALATAVVGMEPGVKPAVAATSTGRVAVLATSGTLHGERFARLVERFAGGVEVATVACPEMVQLVERGDLTSARARSVVAGYVEPLAAEGVDTFVLACTHFPPLRPLIAAAAPAATIIDTGPAVAAQAARVAAAAGIAPGAGRMRCATTGDPAQVAPALARVWGAPLDVAHAGC